MTDDPSRRRSQLVLGVVAIVLIAATMRLPVAALSPLAGRIDVDIPLSALALGALGTAPPIAFALAGVLAPRLARRLQLEPTLLLAMIAMIAGHLVRAAAVDYTMLLIGTLVLLLGAGFGNVLLPAAVKKVTPNRIGTMTAAYAMIMSIGAAVPPLVAVPLAELGDWRLSLAIWAAFVGIAVLPWIALAVGAVRARRAAIARDDGIPVPTARVSRTALLRSPTVWGIAIPFTISSISAYAGYALLPPMLREIAGVGEAEAGALLALLGFLGLPLAALGPVLVARLRTPTPLLVASTALFGTAYAGLLLAPQSATLFWMIALGLGYITFPMCLALFALRTRTPAMASTVSGAVQTVGYAIAAIAPLLLGALRDTTGSWTLALAVLLVLAFGNLVAVPLLGRRGMVDDELGREPASVVGRAEP
ncbi:MFS transporter [Microcella humidisoli]|uniref:MFS transporter n=1 Tax=Microcella humidisoli TaxID=2963406 RepID=A0ABY5FWJ7_9MICO|nr:MFS transporter [Microcella humidisoli]UTT62516.1 MFS transporter [Microcella humidisoli]